MEYIVTIVVALFGSAGFWNWFSNRHASNKDILTAVRNVEGKVATLEDRVGSLQDEQDRDRAEYARLRVLRFNSELLRDQKHTKEEFDQVLDDIDTYEDYCDEHPRYANNKAIMAIENVKRCYEQCLKQHDFL